MGKKLFFLIGLFLLINSLIYADENTINSDKDSFNEFLNYFLSNNEKIKTSIEELKISKANVEKTYGQFDLFLDGTVNYTESKTKPTNNFSPEKTDVLSYKLSLSNKIFTGGILSLSLDLSRTNLLYPETQTSLIPGFSVSSFQSSINPSYKPSISIQYTQPVLKDFWGRPDEKGIEIGKISVKVSEQNLKNTILTQITKLKEYYYSIYLTELLYEIQKEFFNDAKEFYMQTEKLLNTGLKEEKDLYQTKASMLSSKSEIEIYKNNYELAKENFFNICGYPVDKWKDFNITVNEDIEDFYLPDNLSDDLIDTLVESQPEVIISKLSLKMAELDKDIAYNSSLPSLNLIGSYGLEGNSDNIDDSIEELKSKDYNNFLVGVNLSFSFPDRQNSGEIKEKEANLKKNKLSYKELKRQMRIIIKSTYRDVVANKEKYELKKEAEKLEKKRLTIAKDDFAQGRISTQELLLTQNDYHRAQIERINAWYNYLKAIIRWKKITGGYDKYYNDFVKNILNK